MYFARVISIDGKIDILNAFVSFKRNIEPRRNVNTSTNTNSLWIVWHVNFKTVLVDKRRDWFEQFVIIETLGPKSNHDEAFDLCGHATRSEDQHH
jgi:hypothetical protein